jgi:hypothetical protein
MDLRDYITNETAALVDRLIAASQAAVQKARTDAEGVIDAFRAQVEAEKARADAVARQLEGEKTRASALATKLDADAARYGTLASELAVERDRTASLAAALDTAHERVASIDGQLKSLTAQLDTEHQRVVLLESQLDIERGRATNWESQLEAEAARVAALSADLDAAQQLFVQANQAREKAESALQQATADLQGMRELLESARAEAIRSGEAFQAEAAQNALLQQAHESEILLLQSQVDAAVGAAKTFEESLAAIEAKAAAAVDASKLELQSLREQVAALAGEIESKRAGFDAAETSIAAMRVEVDAANALTDATSAEMSALTKRLARFVAMLEGSAASLDRLAAARSVTDLFTTLVRELGNEFERVAIFRLKGNRLEGEQAAGLDDTVDVQKIVVPVGLESVITKALTSRAVEHATKDQFGDGRPPFGGSPASALAAPLVFDGDVFAIAYAESNAPFTEAHGPLAALVIRHANAVLGGLAVELRTSRQLRDYARTLLHEAERMFDADVEAEVPVDVRSERLRDSIRFAQDLYTQRAALDGGPTMNLLDDEIGRLLRETPTPFLAALASVLAARGELRTSASA